MNALILLATASVASALLSLATPTMTAHAYGEDNQRREDHQSYWKQQQDREQPKNSYDQQRETYRQRNYDTYRNGPLEETTREQSKRDAMRDGRDWNPYDPGCKGVYGC